MGRAWRRLNFDGFKSRRKTALWLAPVPTAGGIFDSQRRPAPTKLQLLVKRLKRPAASWSFGKLVDVFKEDFHSTCDFILNNFDRFTSLSDLDFNDTFAGLLTDRNADRNPH